MIPQTASEHSKVSMRPEVGAVIEHAGSGMQACAGLILIDKPEGANSHSVVSFVRRSLGQSRVGHLGTLDPFASGLLPILVGGFTRMSDSLMATQKAYLFTIGLGIETDTLDCAGQTIAQAPIPPLGKDEIEATLTKFRGKIRQIPPVYSALKHNGRPLYEYMRTQGKLNFDIAEKAREVEIFALTLESWTPSELTLSCVCSKGTYVRSLCRDIANALGTLGHCTHLRRTQVGRFVVEDALKIGLTDLKNPGQWTSHLVDKVLQPRQVFPEFPSVNIPAAEEKICQRIEAGNAVEITHEQWWAWSGLASGQDPHEPLPVNKSALERTPGFIQTAHAFFYAEHFRPADLSASCRLIPQKLIAQFP